MASHTSCAAGRLAAGVRSCVLLLLLPVLCSVRAAIPEGLPASFDGSEAELAEMSEQRMRELGFKLGARVRTLKWQKARPRRRDGPPLVWRVGPFKRTAAGPTGPEVGTVPRYPWDSKEADAFLSEGRPVILTNSNFTRFGTETWTPEYLDEHWDDGADIECYVLRSTMKQSNGKPLFYYTDRLDDGTYNMGKFIHRPELVQANVASMSKFLGGLEERAANNLPSGLRMYLQTPLLTTHETVTGSRTPHKILDGEKCYGREIFKDMKDGFDWTMPSGLHDKYGWWPSEQADRHVRHDPHFSDNAWIGDNGLCTPLHYDNMHGMLTQLRGTKRITMFPPSDFHAMVPLPGIHPGARGSHIYDLGNMPQEYRAPFASAKNGVEAIIGPGESLVIPSHWWHHVEQIDDDPLPISYTLFSDHTSYKTELVDEHDLLRRRLEAEVLYTTSLSATYGGQQAVEYLKALDEGRFEQTCEDSPPYGVCARKNLQLMHEYLKDGMPEEFTFGPKPGSKKPTKPIQEYIRHSMKPGETHAEWMTWMVKGRWNLPTTADPPNHVSKGAGPSRRKLSKREKARRRANKRKMDLVKEEAAKDSPTYGGTYAVPGRDSDGATAPKGPGRR